MDLAEQIDNIQGNDIWRTEKKCALYESERIQARIDELVSVVVLREKLTVFGGGMLIISVNVRRMPHVV